MKTKMMRILFGVLVCLAMTAPVHADKGGGPGSNHGCPGHQPPPPPHGGCGK